MFESGHEQMMCCTLCGAHSATLPSPMSRPPVSSPVKLSFLVLSYFLSVVSFLFWVGEGEVLQFSPSFNKKSEIFLQFEERSHLQQKRKNSEDSIHKTNRAGGHQFSANHHQICKYRLQGARENSSELLNFYN